MPPTQKSVRNDETPKKAYRDKYPKDIRDWVSYHNTHDSLIQPLLKAEVAQFYETLRKFNRNDFPEHLAKRIVQLKSQQEIVQTLYTRYEAAFLKAQLTFHASQRSTSKARARTKPSEIVAQAQQIEPERQALDLVRSWKSYLDERVVAMDELLCHWGDIWDWYECGLYGGVHRGCGRGGKLPNVNEHIGLFESIESVRRAG